MTENKKENLNNTAENIATHVVQDQMMNILISAAIPGASPIINIMHKGSLKATGRELMKSATLETAQELTKDDNQQEAETADTVGIKVLTKMRGRSNG